VIENNTYDPIFQTYLDSLYIISHSQGTLSMNLSGLKRFESYVKQKHGSNVAKLIEQISNGMLNPFSVLQNFVIYLDQEGKRPTSIKCWLSSTKGFLRQQGIKIYSEDFKQNVRVPKTIRQREDPLTKEIIVRLLQIVPFKLRAVILVALASGMRIGEIVQLKISDIDFESEPLKIRIRAETTKTKESRETFLTQEATRIVKDYLRRYYNWNSDQKNEQLQNQIIFGRTVGIKSNNSRTLKKNPARNDTTNLGLSLRYYTSKIPELARLNENGRNMIHFHAFRTFFRTTVGNAVGRDFAEAIIGHHFYLDSYYNLPEEERKKLYLKAEPYITISDFRRVEKDLISMKKKQEEIEEKQIELIQALQGDHILLPKLLEKLIK